MAEIFAAAAVVFTVAAMWVLLYAIWKRARREAWDGEKEALREMLYLTAMAMTMLVLAVLAKAAGMGIFGNW